MGNTISSRPEDGNPMKIWDVPTLWKEAENLPVFSVVIDNLEELDRVAWYGSDEHSGRLTVRQVINHAKQIQDADPNEPILLSAEGKVLDGFHRITKANMLALSHIPAKQFSKDPEPIRVVDIPDYIYKTYFQNPLDPVSTRLDNES